MCCVQCSRQQQPLLHTDARDDVGGGLLEGGSDTHSDSSADTVEEGHSHPVVGGRRDADGIKQGKARAAIW